MRITCPHCGPRDLQEFSYFGDATVRRPEGPSATQEQMFEYVYLRDNPRGLHEELWFHGAGCQNWLVARRDTATHAVESVKQV